MTSKPVVTVSICRAMRCFLAVLLVASWGAFGGSRILRAHHPATAPGSIAQTPAVTLDAIREKIGSSRVQALEVTGSVERLVQSGRVLGVAEKTAQLRSSLIVRFQIPDKYIRIEEQQVPSGAMIHTTGFDGPRLLNKTATRGKDVQFSANWGPEQLSIEQAAFARLLLGWLVRDAPVFPLQWRELSRAEVPPGRIAWEVTGDGGFTARLTVDMESLRPRSLEYRAVRRTLTGVEGTETRVLEFGAFRRIAGVTLPFDTRIVVGDKVIEHTTLTGVRVNPRFTPADFVPR